MSPKRRFNKNADALANAAIDVGDFETWHEQSIARLLHAVRTRADAAITARFDGAHRAKDGSASCGAQIELACFSPVQETERCTLVEAGAKVNAFAAESFGLGAVLALLERLLTQALISVIDK